MNVGELIDWLEEFQFDAPVTLKLTGNPLTQEPGLIVGNTECPEGIWFGEI